MAEQIPHDTDCLYCRRTAHGTGVFAGKPFRKGEAVFVAHGELFYTLAEQPNPYGYGEQDRTVQIGEDLFMGPTGDFDDFINHSCEPNIALIIPEQLETWVSYVAIRDIAAGEEITWDYSTTMCGDDWEMECRCGSPNCRGLVREFRFLSEEVQRKYIEMGIVPGYVLKKIKGMG